MSIVVGYPSLFNYIDNVTSLQTQVDSIADNVVYTTNLQTITNKTINSTNNTIEVNSTNINNLINQPLLTTSSPAFNSITIVEQLLKVMKNILQTLLTLVFGQQLRMSP